MWENDSKEEEGYCNYHNCEHFWVEKYDSQFNNEFSTDVVCEKCKCPGQKDKKTGKVFWPAT